MYDTALPPQTLRTLLDTSAADIVIGIPSYRNAATIQQVTSTASSALHRYYPHLSCLLLHVDGLTQDETLALAQTVALPPNVRQITTRYLGLPGKGSALRAIFEGATALQAQAVVILEADTESITPEWIPALVEPLLRKEANFVLPRYAGVAPTALTNDLLAYPLMASLYQMPLRYPLAGEVAMAGGVAAYFAERDVWETDVARDGVNGWMTLQLITDGGRIAEVAVGEKRHRASESFASDDLKFIQQTGTLLRTGLLHEQVWRAQERTIPLLRTEHANPPGAAAPPDPARLAAEASRLIDAEMLYLWAQLLHPATTQRLHHALSGKPPFRLESSLWVTVVQEFFVLYNLGEGDPDKALAALYTLYLLRAGTLAANANGDPARWETEVQAQAEQFRRMLPALLRQWESYTPSDG